MPQNAEMVVELNRKLSIYCYSVPADEVFLTEFDKQMSVFKQQFDISIWNQNSIFAGSEYMQETHRYINEADVILLFVSADFLAHVTSGLSQNIIQQALQRHRRHEALVIPILLRPVDWKMDGFSDLKPLPSNGLSVTRWPNREEAYVDIVDGIRHATSEWSPRRRWFNQWVASSDHYQVQALTSGQSAQKDAENILTKQSVFYFNAPLPNQREFFGRRRESITLLDRIGKLSATSIVGPRRIGKTWLLQYAQFAISDGPDTRYRVASVDATLPMCSSLDGFIATVLSELKVSTEYLRATHYDLVLLEQATRDIRSKGEIPVLFIDEFEGLVNERVFDIRFFTSLRAIAQAGLVLVTASRYPLIDLVSTTLKTSPFFNIFEKLTLKPFMLQEAEHFFLTKGKAANFTPQEQEYFMQYSRASDGTYLPIRLQLVGTMLLEEKMLMILEGSNIYQAADPASWADFEQRLAEKYQELV